MFTGCRSVPEKDELALVYYDLGLAYSRLGRAGDARQAFERSFMLKPDLVKAGYNLGRMDIEMGKYDAGLKIFFQILKKDPENNLLKEAVAWGYYRKGEYAKAVEWYREVLKSDGYNRHALYNISVLLCEEGRYREAYPYLKQIDEMGDSDSFIYMKLGETEKELGISSGSYWFKLASDKDPSNRDALKLLCDSYVEDKNYSLAIDVCNKLLSKGEDKSVMFEKAFILLVYVEDYDNGLPALKKALDAGFSDEKEIKRLEEYPDLLHRDMILSVIRKAGTPPPGAQD